MNVSPHGCETKDRSRYDSFIDLTKRMEQLTSNIRVACIDLDLNEEL